MSLKRVTYYAADFLGTVVHEMRDPHRERANNDKTREWMTENARGTYEEDIYNFSGENGAQCEIRLIGEAETGDIMSISHQIEQNPKARIPAPYSKVICIDSQPAKLPIPDELVRGLTDLGFKEIPKDSKLIRMARG